MNRSVLAIICAALVLAALAVMFRPRPTVIASSSRTVTTETAPDGQLRGSSGPRVVVRIDGEEVTDSVLLGSKSFAELPVEQLTSSMISHVRTSGRTEVLVLADGSEIRLDAYTRERLAPEIAFRTTYNRGAGGG
jgi:hypothetical protein